LGVNLRLLPATNAALSRLGAEKKPYAKLVFKEDENQKDETVFDFVSFCWRYVMSYDYD